MSLTEKFEQFIAKIDWDELSLGAQETLYEATRGVPNEEGLPFSVFEGDDGRVVISYNRGEAEIKLFREELTKFREWLEEEFMGGEMGETYFPMEQEKEKDDIRERREMKSEFEIKSLVSALLREYRSRFSIAQSSFIPFTGGLYKADFVVYDKHDRYQLVIAIKTSAFIKEQTFIRIFDGLLPAYPGTSFILTDGEVAFLRISHEDRIMRLSFKSALDVIFPIANKEEKLVLIGEIKTYLSAALDTFKKDLYNGDIGDKLTLLYGFVNTLQEANIEHDPQEPSYLYFEEKTEREFFHWLLGSYNGNRIVKYGSKRVLNGILEYKTMNMCSLACMNDPSEGTYANKYMKIEPREEDKSNIPFILSGCPENNDDSLTMWRLYADDAKGVSITFDIDRNKLNDEFYLAPISYSKSDGTHFELDIIKQILLNNHQGTWRFTIKNWHIWKHFFKKYIYADEQEVRLLYVPKQFNHNDDGKWFDDERTSIHAEMALFKLTDPNSPFPLTLRKIRLGSKFPVQEINVNQYNHHFKLRTDILIAGGNRESIVIPSDIEDYR